MVANAKHATTRTVRQTRIGRLLALTLALMLTFSMVPVQAFAGETEPDTGATTLEQEQTVPEAEQTVPDSEATTPNPDEITPEADVDPLYQGDDSVAPLLPLTDSITPSAVNFVYPSDGVIATIKVASDAFPVYKTMNRGSQWSTDGMNWQDSELYLTPGNTYYIFTSLSDMAESTQSIHDASRPILKYKESYTTSILPNIKADVTVDLKPGVTTLLHSFMVSYAYGCTNLTSLGVPDISAVTTVGTYFMSNYAYGCTSLTYLGVPDTSKITLTNRYEQMQGSGFSSKPDVYYGSYFMYNYASHCSSLTSLDAPDLSSLNSIGDYTLFGFANSCTSLTSLGIPNTSSSARVLINTTNSGYQNEADIKEGTSFMRSYAQNCNALNELVMSAAPGYLAEHIGIWSIPVNATYDAPLIAKVPSNTLAAWRALTVSYKTLGSNRITNPEQVQPGNGTDPTTTHNISVASNITNGTITADNTVAKEGYPVRLTVTPDSGYRIQPDSLTVSFLGGTAKCTPIDSKSFEFVMPAADVIVSVVFEQKQTPSFPAAGVMATIEVSDDYDDLASFNNITGKLWTEDGSIWHGPATTGAVTPNDNNALVPEAGHTYYVFTTKAAVSRTDTTAIIPNVPADVTVEISSDIGTVAAGFLRNYAYGCNKLTSLSVPDLSNVTLASNTTYFMSGYAYGCSSLTSLDAPDISGLTLATTNTYFLYQYAQGCTSLTSLDVPDTSGITGAVGNYFLANYAYGCTSLASLDVPDTSNIKTVGTYFLSAYANGCSGLTSLDAPDISSLVLTTTNTYFLYQYAQRCTSLTSLDVPDTSGITGAVGNYFLASYTTGCTSLEELEVPDTSKITTVGTYFLANYAYGCTSLEELEVPDTSGVTAIGTYFLSSYAYGCTSLTSLDVPSIAALTSKSIPASFLRQYAYGCTSLTSLAAPDTSGFTTAGEYFLAGYANGCTSLTSLGIPDTTTFTTTGTPIANFMVDYATGDSALDFLEMSSAPGYFVANNVSWGVPADAATDEAGLKARVPLASLDAWSALATYDRTLGLNQILDPNDVIPNDGSDVRLSYSITVTAPINGVVTTAATAKTGNPTVLTVTPDIGYAIADSGITISWVDGENANQTVPVLRIDANTFSFVMPAANVTVSSIFTLISAVSWPENGIRATIEVDPEATSVIKTMPVPSNAGKTSQWSTDGVYWSSAPLVVQPGKTYYLYTPVYTTSFTSNSILPNVKATVTVTVQLENDNTVIGNNFMSGYARDCTNLTSLSAPDLSDITKVGDNFMSEYAYRCTSLTSLGAPFPASTVPASEPQLMEVGSGFLSSYANGCTSLTSLGAPNTQYLTKAGNNFMSSYANNCTSLKLLDTPVIDGITSGIGSNFLSSYANGCTSLTSLGVPDTSGIIGTVGASFLANYANGCTSLTSLGVPDTSGISGTVGTSFLESYANGCTSLEELEVPETSGVTGVSNNFLYKYAQGCTSLTNLDAPDTSNIMVTSAAGISTYFMSAYAQGCTSLINLGVPDTSAIDSTGPYFMAYYAQGCTSLESLDAPITSNISKSYNSHNYFLTNYAQGCTSLKLLDAPDIRGISKIGSNFLSGYASGCTSLTTLGIPDTTGFLASGAVAGNNFMLDYAFGDSALDLLKMSSATGYFNANNVFWGVPVAAAADQNGLRAEVPQASLAEWTNLTNATPAPGRTLFLNQIKDAGDVYVKDTTDDRVSKNVTATTPTNGSVVPNHNPAIVGYQTTLKVTPDTDYWIADDGIVVSWVDGLGETQNVTATRNSENIFGFVMPDADVTVTASFQKKTTSLNWPGAGIMATIVVAADADTVTKSMIVGSGANAVNSQWSPDGYYWSSTDITLNPGKTYYLYTPVYTTSFTGNSILPNVKATVTVTVQLENDNTVIGNNFMSGYARDCTNLTSLGAPDLSDITKVGDNFMSNYANGCKSLTELGVPDTSLLETAGTYFMGFYANGCTSLTELGVPDTSLFETTYAAFMYNYAYGCTSLTELGVPDTSLLETAEGSFMFRYAQGCTSLTELGVPDTSLLKTVEGSFMSYYATGCTSLTELGVPDTSQITNVPGSFMNSYAEGCTSLTTLGVPDTTNFKTVSSSSFMSDYAKGDTALDYLIAYSNPGYLARHNISWGVPAAAAADEAGLEFIVYTAAVRDEWKPLTATGRTLALNQIIDVANVVVPVTWSNLTSNGTANTATTTALTLTFNTDPVSLTAGDITIAGATKGTLSGTGNSRTLTISNITVAEGQTVKVDIASPTGFVITPNSQTVVVHVAKVVTAIPSLSYSAHIQDVGDGQGYVSMGKHAGTTGSSKRLEGITLKLGNEVSGLGIRYTTHIQDLGWENTKVSWKTSGQESGSRGSSKRLEAIKIELTGTAAANYDIYYQVHAQDAGWLAWAKNGQEAGSAGFSYRLEAIRIVIVAKGGDPNTVAGLQAITGAVQPVAYLDAKAKGDVAYTATAHIQNLGNRSFTNLNDYIGTAGQSLRVEALTFNSLSLPLGVTGSIQYRTHIQNDGDQEWKNLGTLSGTTAESKRLEAINIRLTGDLATKYDVYYRTHVQNIGWTGWAKNGTDAANKATWSGSAGYGYRMEAMQVVIVAKDSNYAPGILSKAYFVR